MIGRKVGSKLVEKSTSRLPVNRTLFEYCSNMVVIDRCLSARGGTVWDYYNDFINRHQIKTKKDLEAVAAKYAADRYISKKPRQKRKG